MVRAMDPIQNLLLMMFFVSVGLLIDLAFVWRHIGTVLLLIGLVFLLNSVINVLALRTVGASWRVAVLAGFALAQIGEFAFVLAAAGAASGADRRRRAAHRGRGDRALDDHEPLVAGARAPPARVARGRLRGALAVVGAARCAPRREALRQGSEQLVQSSAQLAARLGGRIERVTLRHRARTPGPARPQRLR